MNLALLSGEKTGTNLESLGSQHHCSGNSPAVCNSAGADHRNFHRIKYLGNQAHGCNFTDVTACFGTFYNYGVCAVSLHPLCQRNRRHHRNKFHTGIFKTFCIFGGVSGSGRYNRQLFLANKLCQIIGIRTYHHNIYTKRLICHFFGFSDFFPNHLSRSVSACNQANAARVGNRSRQFSLCHPSHTALDNRIFYA